MAKALLEAVGITKIFGGTVALDGVSFEVQKGEVHAIVGENGAGKSTLVKIISGTLQPTHGQLFVEGKPIEFHTPLDAMRWGIGIVHQHPAIAPELTIAENIFLGRVPTDHGFVDWKHIRTESEAAFFRVGMEVDVSKQAFSLNSAERQMVALARALHAAGQILILDEPSAVLGPSDLETLFEIIERLKNEGISILYISHRLAEVFAIADRVTVLKDGKYVGTYVLDGSIDRDFLISRMVGREWTDAGRQAVGQLGPELLRVENLTSAQSAFRDVSFAVHAGEIVGIAGLVGAGRTEVCKAIFGAHPIRSGQVFLKDSPVQIRSPREAISHRVAYLPEDRHREGLAIMLPIRMNISLAVLDRLSHWWVLRLGQEKRLVHDMMKQLRVVAAGPNQVVLDLSGGNQQKVVVAKWLSTQADVFLFDEPTAGVDVGAKQEIHDLIKQLVKKGAAVVLVSSEMPELLANADRILVMRGGRISGELDGRSATEEQILHLAA